ncbi:hypothetical protein C8A03DRAFT_35199 [Achaetomium macrosporum]|uniref:Uncharacterized protein n=1 Tax=Achaetomium macrosporum TaxID=79813 RepID=A0AAN7C7J4_9PEZI|nr:hypothetical protein C8A03DRAFT_35199 [Achaetomium macrosporum]
MRFDNTPLRDILTLQQIQIARQKLDCRELDDPIFCRIRQSTVSQPARVVHVASVKMAPLEEQAPSVEEQARPVEKSRSGLSSGNPNNNTPTSSGSNTPSPFKSSCIIQLKVPSEKPEGSH